MGRRLLRASLGSMVLGVGISAPLLAAEVPVQNDSLASPAAGNPCQCFLSSEEVAAWLTSPCTGDLVAAEIGWASPFGGNPASLETAITVRAGGAFPTPGATLMTQGGNPAIVVGPMLADGILNQFRFLDPPTNTQSLRLPVTSGQVVVVSLEFLNQTSGNPFASDVVWDADGCQSGKNTVFAIPGGWSDACPLGVAGDWMIRAVVDCQATTTTTSTTSTSTTSTSSTTTTTVPPIPTTSSRGVVLLTIMIALLLGWRVALRTAAQGGPPGH
jgi:hypothetical protein